MWANETAIETLVNERQEWCRLYCRWPTNTFLLVSLQLKHQATLTQCREWQIIRTRSHAFASFLFNQLHTHPSTYKCVMGKKEHILYYFSEIDTMPFSIISFGFFCRLRFTWALVEYFHSISITGFIIVWFHERRDCWLLLRPLHDEIMTPCDDHSHRMLPINNC